MPTIDAHAHVSVPAELWAYKAGLLSHRGAHGFRPPKMTDDELIEAVSLPVTGKRCAFREVARRHGDFAIVACAAVAIDSGVRLAVGGVADMPATRDLPRLEGSALDDALNAFAYELDARDDVHATARYRRDLVRMIGRDLVREVLQ